jgi:hypothetical protein
LSGVGSRQIALREQLIAVGLAVLIAGLIIYLLDHEFRWRQLVGPALGSIFVVMAQRRQKHWDDLRSRRENGEGALNQLSDINAAEQALKATDGNRGDGLLNVCYWPLRRAEVNSATR